MASAEPERHTFVVMVEITSEDPRLSPDELYSRMSSVEGADATRHLLRAIVAEPESRIVAVMPVPAAKVLLAAWQDAARVTGNTDKVVHAPQRPNRRP